jgi:hypothetical protein
MQDPDGVLQRKAPGTRPYTLATTNIFLAGMRSHNHQVSKEGTSSNNTKLRNAKSRKMLTRDIKMPVSEKLFFVSHRSK